MFKFAEWLEVLDEDMESMYFEVFDHHDREIFYGHGVEIPKDLKSKTVMSFSIIDAGCFKIVLYRSILDEDEEVTDSWKQLMLCSVYNHVKANEDNGVYDNSLTTSEFADTMRQEIQTFLDDFNDDTGAIIDWEDLADDCKNYVSSVPVA